MSKLNLTASTQYNDYVGEVAFDKADTQNLANYLAQNQLKTSDEFILGFEVFIHPLSLTPSSDIDVEIYLGNISDDKHRKIEISVNLITFFKLFKRVSLVAKNRHK